MIAALRRFVSRRVGRRLFLLFIVSAFLPLAALAALSFMQLRDMLLQQGEQRLAATAKGYAMTLFERLLLASDVAAAAAGRGAGPPATGSLARLSLHSLARVEPDGRVVAVFGNPPLEPLAPAVRERIEEGKSVVTVKPATGGARVTITVPTTRGGEGAAVAEILPEYLWQPELFPTETDFCVLEEKSRVMLFCSTKIPDDVLAATVPAPSEVPSALLATRWLRDGEPQRSIAWTQFLRYAFETPDWVVVASQPESFQLARLLEYQHIYVPVVLLALLIVGWLTIRQARSIVGPVVQLAARARGISRNDFESRVEMDRQDEFGELASAFNQMSSQLGRQFAALTALSEIDRLILSTPDTAQVVRTVLERMRAVVPAHFIGVTLFDHDAPGHAHSYFSETNSTEGLAYARATLRTEDYELLGRNPDGAWVALVPGSRGILGVLAERGLKVAYIQPIVWRDVPCGALALGYRDETSGGDEERRQARDFADRVAVAVSSAWRDEQLYQQAHFDPLTGLPNRLLLKDRLTQEIARGQREQRRFALLFIDIDRFKNVNDTLGHTAGDAVLAEAGRRIQGCVRDSDTVARLGGDEFTVILTNVHDPQDAGHVAEEIVAMLSESFEIDGQSTFLSASVGIVAYPEDGTTAEDLLRNADTAMYRAKAAGRATVVFFEETMNAEAVSRLMLDRDLRQAITKGEIAMHYQPLLDLRTGVVCGAEALMRWNHPEHGPIPPARFVPVAEESGFIDELGRFALDEACARMKAWRAEGLPVKRVSVNVSPRQLRKVGIVALVQQAADGAGIPHECLEIEITEGLLIEHADSVEGLLRGLSASGVKIALDDFGTGFSSLAYLNRFPIDTIKIDRVFIDGLGYKRDSEAIVVAIIAMSHALGKSVTAEGVESAAQLEMLTEFGCDSIQGYFVGRPMPAAEFVAFVRNRAPEKATAPILPFLSR
ncbi:putative bifunctional diguanylate cyclase/phosphodiesterase [Usitatibacter palustris]|uniref:Diguanylate cyclase (GGDEF) domain-containing protein n=1 Tax=Usitatibacter palustris TaxID=2732487 RepID=A0A6M4H9W2_9PROT|nr:EAL domain-containing protein [Usitatibacter palustris]QJR16559.1 hypothetical protein DSM104440_03394 [Usitatibacter palustris]